MSWSLSVWVSWISTSWYSSFYISVGDFVDFADANDHFDFAGVGGYFDLVDVGSCVYEFGCIGSSVACSVFCRPRYLIAAEIGRHHRVSSDVGEETQVNALVRVNARQTFPEGTFTGESF